MHAMMSREVSASKKRWSPGSDRWLPLFSLLVAIFCIWMFTLPTFPSEDGPIHLYFATVLSDLLRHGSPLYSHYYYVRHVLPPYSIHYYLLIALMKVMSAPLAEKIVVCLIFCNFAFGFRYLAKGIGAAGEVFSLLIAALMLNWPLGMGFENFALSLGFACWALGFWCRLQDRPGLLAGPAMRYRIGFVSVVALMTLTHPLPVLLVIGFAGMDFVLRMMADRLWKQPAVPTGAMRTATSSLATLVAAGCTLGYIYLYSDRKKIAASANSGIHPVHRFMHYARLNGIAYFGGHTMGAHLYRWSLDLVLLTGLVFGLFSAARHVRNRRWDSSLSWTVSAFVLLIAICVLPDDVSGSHFVTDRLVIAVWLAALASASGMLSLSRDVKLFVALGAIAITVLNLSMGEAYLRPAAKRLAELEIAPIATHGQVGLLMPADGKLYGSGDHLQFYPFMWGGTYYFRRSGSVMLNTPWMDVSWLPLGNRPGMLTKKVSFDELENYQHLRKDLLRSSAARDAVMPDVQTILFAGGGETTDQATIQPVLDLAHLRWSCRTDDWYEVCAR